MTSPTPPSTLPPPGTDAPVSVRGFITDPKLVGYQVLTNYESTYWAPLVGNEAWRLFEVLRSFCHQDNNSCFPSINLLLAILGIKDRSVLIGRTKPKIVNGKEYSYPGLIQILQTHNLVIAEAAGEGPTLRYTFHVHMTPGLLTNEQLAQMPEILRKKHAELLERCAEEQRKLEAKKLPSKLQTDKGKDTPKRLEEQGLGNSNTPLGNSNTPSWNFQDKQQPINNTHKTEASARAINHNSSGNGASAAVVVALTQMGLAASTAQRLAQRYRHERIEEKIAFLEFLLESAPEKVKNPRGWLRRAIEEDYGPPDGFLSQTERQRQSAAAAQQAQDAEAQAIASEAARRALQDRVQAQQEAARQALYAQYGTTQEEIDLWQQVLEELRMHLEDATYHAYLAGTLLLSLRDDRALIGLANPATKDWIENRLAKRIRDRLALSLNGRRVALQWMNLVDDNKGPPRDAVVNHANKSVGPERVSAVRRSDVSLGIGNPDK